MNEIKPNQTREKNDVYSQQPVSMARASRELTSSTYVLDLLMNNKSLFLFASNMHFVHRLKFFTLLTAC